MLKVLKISKSLDKKGITLTTLTITIIILLILLGVTVSMTMKTDSGILDQVKETKKEVGTETIYDYLLMRAQKIEEDNALTLTQNDVQYDNHVPAFNYLNDKNEVINDLKREGLIESAENDNVTMPNGQTVYLPDVISRVRVQIANAPAN